MRTRQMTVPLLPIGCGSTGRALVERSLREVPGVLEASVNPVTEMAYVEFDPAKCREDEVMAAVDRTGYAETPTAGPPGPARAGAAGRGLSVKRLALAGGLWLALAFTVCAAGAALFPELDGGLRLWALLLPGIYTLGRGWYVLGVAEAFVLGTFGTWLFAWIYDAIPWGEPRPRGPAHASGRPTPAPKGRKIR